MNNSIWDEVSMWDEVNDRMHLRIYKETGALVWEKVSKPVRDEIRYGEMYTRISDGVVHAAWHMVMRQTYE